MVAPTYTIVTVADLLKVPSERREACLRELVLGLELLEFAGGEDGIELRGLTWTDDGDKSVSLLKEDGKPFLHLKVSKV